MPGMEQTVNDLLTKERRRQRTMVASVVLGLGLVVISSRSERAMFQFGSGLPGVFATLREGGPAMPRVSLREGSPAAFFAGLGRFGKPTEPGNGRIIPAASLEQIGPRSDELLFVGPQSELPPGNGFLSDPLNPDLTAPPGSISLPGSGDPGSRRVISNDGGSSSGGGSSGGGSSTGGGSTGGTSSSTGGTDGGSSSSGGSSTGGTDGGSSSGGTTSSGGDGGSSSSGGSSSGGTPSAVPEPASWILMIGGFLGIGAAMRARRKQNRSTALTATR